MKNITEEFVEKLKSRGRVEKIYHQTAQGELSLSFTLEIILTGESFDSVENQLNEFFNIEVTAIREKSKKVVEQIVSTAEEINSKNSYKELCKAGKECIQNKEYDKAKGFYSLALSAKSSNHSDAKNGLELAEKWIKALEALKAPLTGQIADLDDVETPESTEDESQEEEVVNESVTPIEDAKESEEQDELIPEVTPESTTSGMYVRLLPEEEAEYRLHARENYIPNTPINNVWHPVYIDECNKINQEELEAFSIPDAEQNDDEDSFLPPPFEV